MVLFSILIYYKHYECVPILQSDIKALQLPRLSNVPLKTEQTPSPSTFTYIKVTFHNQTQLKRNNGTVLYNEDFTER